MVPQRVLMLRRGLQRGSRGTRLLNLVFESRASRLIADAERKMRKWLTHPVTALVSTRVCLGVLNLFVISIISFVVITLPPGDFV